MCFYSFLSIALQGLKSLLPPHSEIFSKCSAQTLTFYNSNKTKHLMVAQSLEKYVLQILKFLV